MSRARLFVLAVVAVAILAFFAVGGPRYVSFENVKAQAAGFQQYYEAHRVQTVAVYFVVYVLVTALSLPGALVMTLVGGAIFGLVWGTVIVSFASSLGATLAFLAARFVLRDWVRAKFGRFLEPVDTGIRREGAFYLFTLRLIPAVPFFVINLAMGLTAMRARTFYGVSQLGMLPGTLVFVAAGSQLAAIESPAGILSPGLVGLFVLIGVFPLLAKRLVGGLRARRVYARWPRPPKFDRNLVVIGAGSAGLVSAYIAAAVRAKVTLVEKHRMGGDCLNTGCVPSKALIKSARVLSQIRNAPRYGIRSATAEFEFADVMERVQRVVRAVEPHDSVERYSALGVECLRGEAKITSPWTVQVNGKTLTTRSIIIAAGARPFVPRIPGIEAVEVLTSDTVWGLRELPARLAVLGGGPIGAELAQAFARFGSKVTQVEMLPRLLAREDPDISELVRSRFVAEGIEVLTGHRAKRFEGKNVLVCEREGGELRIEFDALLCAVGRKPNIEGYGLEELGIPLTKARTVETNEYLQTLYPNIYACGDVAGPYQFTHTASHQAWYAAVNALFGGLRRFRADYRVIPWATFTDPEIARVGLNETDARAANVPYELTVYRMEELDRAITEEAAYGLVKVLTVPGKDRILGATIAGENAGELIIEFVAAMKHGIGLNKILGTIHVYPTLAEANKHAAGVWKKAHVPEGVLRNLERFHAWMRG
ncbi:MAG: pyridine nucleotide-disulfide oxidoreductase [Betaproteobacteria bacterium RIFCSPLOWO2_12_FULL_65_14]|nr:MAG: pyridine nucleotide-disulfide oxidoreductase [Betaproteobacteria bacterium RIFCSPLOWO2_12_FULL_65_14]